YFERGCSLDHTPVIFRDDAHLLRIIDRIVSRVGRRIDESSPMVDARLQDGSRVNAIIPPLAIDGPILSIRRFGRSPLTANDLLRLGSFTPEMITVLRAMVRARLNILISGVNEPSRRRSLAVRGLDRKGTRSNSSHVANSY